jgi:hypothetical protein
LNQRTAKPGFDNSFVLAADEDVDLTGVTGASGGACGEGLLLTSTSNFELDAFATEWYSTDLYSVSIPIVMGVLAGNRRWWMDEEK